MTLKEMRERAGWSGERVARKLEVSRQSLYNWETGAREPSAQNIRKLAECYGVTADEILEAIING